jgi:hypothetical protein
MSSDDIRKLKKAEALVQKVQNHVVSLSKAESSAYRAAFDREFVKNGRLRTHTRSNKNQVVISNQEYKAAAERSKSAARMLNMAIAKLHGVEQEIKSSMKRSSMKRSSGGKRHKQRTHRNRRH